jgi:hypothetical protein
MKIEFKEEQKFTQWWLWLILITIGILTIYGIYKQLIIGEPFGTEPISNFGLILSSTFSFGLIILFGIMRLKTEVDQIGIKVYFFPFFRKTIKWDAIKSVKTVNYGFVGGWGIRLGTKYGTIYNMKGNKGLAIELKNGNRFCLGTQKDSELNKIIEKYQ